MAFNLADYETVADRLERFWTDHPNGKINSELVHNDDKRFIVRAFIYRDAAASGVIIAPDATGYAEELVGSTNVNKTSALENCETSAIGRALANLGYAPKGQRPSREEMSKVVRGNPIPARPRPSPADPSIDEARLMTDRPKVCPDCGSKVFDNRDTNRQRTAEGKKPMPAFKCTNRSCSAASGEPWISWEASFFDDGQLIVDKGTGEIVSPPVARDDYGPDEAPF